MRVLISGAGIAGPTLAYWLAYHGMEPTIVETAPRLRSGGYMIDFWGLGLEIADRMGLLPEIRRKGYVVERVRIVDRRGKQKVGFPADALVRVTQGRFISLPRGDLAASIFERIEGRVETIFNDSISRIRQSETSVHVAFDSGQEREFDLVVGADGLHSRVRELVFGPQARFEKFLGYKAAAFEVSEYRPRDELTYVLYTEVGQQVVRFSMRDDRTMFLFTFADDEVADVHDVQAQRDLLRRRFGASGWECPRILEMLDDCDLYFDRVSQIRMDPHEGLWTRGRVTLIGDAASCVSLLAGQGSALAMVAAYILAGELRRADGDYERAFSQYRGRFEPFILRKQKAAMRMADMFAPKSRFSLIVRNQVMNLMTIPWVAELAVGRDLADHITVPEY